ncbi:Popeye protein [Trinorchestia longiramus]|nr:Popeye protein [Trinorchestia longiramus]
MACIVTQHKTSCVVRRYNTKLPACHNTQRARVGQHNTRIGNLMCLVAFLVPHNFRASGVLMRSSLAGAMVLFSAWASVKLCALDMLLWYVSLTAVNLVHACRLGYVLWPARITPELTDVYDKLFRPLKVPRVPFMQLAREGRIEMLPAGHIYAEEDITTAATRLSLLLSGRLSVSCDSTHLHYIFPNQFVDSPEWETNRHVEHPTELFQVTVVSDEASVLLVWPREKLLALLHTNDSLSSVILNLVGRDITTKLYSLTEQQEQQRSNSTSMLMPGDRVRPLLRGMASGSGAYGRVSRPSFCHSNQTDPRLTRQILDSLPGSSEKCSSSNVRTAGSNVKKETSSDAGGCNAVRETLGALSHTSPDLLDQTTPSVINGANHEVQSSRDDTQTPHSRHSDGEELASTGRGSNTEGKELSTGIAHNDGVMRLVPYQSSTHFSSPSASSSSHKHVKTDLLHDSYSPSSSLLSDPALVETAV